MHVDIYLRILVEGIYPSSNGSEDLKKIQAKNRWKLALYSAGLFVLLLGMFAVAKVSLADRYFRGFPLDIAAFLLACIFTIVFGGEFVISKLTIPLSIAKNLNADLAHKCWEAKQHDYIQASLAFTKVFWKRVSKGNMEKAMQETPREAKTATPAPARQYASTAAISSPRQQMSGWMLYTLILMTIVAVIAVLNFLGINMSFIGSSPMVTIPLGLLGLFCSFLIYAIIRIGGMKERSWVKSAITLLCVFMFVATGAGMIAWATESVRNDVLAAFTGIDYSSISQASFAAKLPAGDDLASVKVTDQPTNTPTATSTLEPSPTPRIITKSSGVYTVKSQEIAGENMAADLGIIAANANLDVDGFSQMLAKMKEENADSADWKAFYWDDEGVAAASIKNRGYLTIGTTKDGRAVADFFSRVAQLQTDGALKKDDAYALKAIATLLNEWWNRQDTLGLLLVKTQELLDNAAGDSTKVNTTELSDTFAKAKNVILEINELTDAYNKSRLEGMPEIKRFSVPDNKNFVEFLESAYAADSEDVYETATPGPKPDNIVATLLPPTETPQPTATIVPTATQDACHAGISTDEQAQNYQGDYAKLESLSVELRSNKALRIERWSEECGGWVFAIVNYNDEIYYWGVVKTIPTTTGYGQYGTLAHDRSNFRIVSLDDPTGNGLPMVIIEDSGEYLIRNWPAPVLPTYTAVPGGGQTVRQCQSAPPGYFDSQKLNSRWEDLNAMFPGMQGTYEYNDVAGQKVVRPKASVWYYACPDSDEYFFIIFVKDKGAFWLVQRNTPSNIGAQHMFWFKEDNTPYDIVMN